MLDLLTMPSLYLPDSWLEAVANRHYTFLVQRYHFVLRLGHIMSAAAFFGGVGLFDLRLMGWRTDAPLRGLGAMLPFLYATFGVAMVSGVMLFLYAPVQVGSHAWFLPKLILLVLGMVNVQAYYRLGFHRLTVDPLPKRVRLCAALSLVFWTGVMMCSSLNVETWPKVILR